jgi:hypothetical protein
MLKGVISIYIIIEFCVIVYTKTLHIGFEPMTLRLTAARSNQLS